MTTAGNALTHGVPSSSEGNALLDGDVVEESVTDPTLGNGDGTYDLTFSSVRVLGSTDDVVGVEWDGDHKVSVDSVDGSTVSILFESPSGTDTFTNESDGALSGTLTVRARQ